MAGKVKPPTQVHVTKPKSGGWNVTPDNKKPIGNFGTQAEAQKVARDLLIKTGGELIIHGRDNLIRDKDTIAPANDPFPPKG